MPGTLDRRALGARRAAGLRGRVAASAPVIASVACLLSVAGASSPPAAGASTIAPKQDLVALFAPHNVWATPASGGSRVAVVGAGRPITRERTTLPVISSTVDAAGRSWLRVRLPGRILGGRPPPRTGWISGSKSSRLTTAWHLVVDRRARRLLVYRNGRRVRTYQVIVGKPATPTPRGDYFVEENVRLPASALGAPFALASSARSAVWQEFDGGPGQIALHGVANIGGRLGTAASNGCIRMSAGAITWLAARIGPGVPITIR